MFSDKNVPLRYKVYLILFIIGFTALLYGIKTAGQIKEPSESQEMVMFLTESYKNYIGTDSEDIKIMIYNSVKNEYPDIDPSSISNEYIREFYKTCIGE